MSFVGQIGVGAERMVYLRLGFAYRLGLPYGRFRAVFFLISIVGDTFWGSFLVARSMHSMYKQVVLKVVLLGRG